MGFAGYLTVCEELIILFDVLLELLSLINEKLAVYYIGGCILDRVLLF